MQRGPNFGPPSTGLSCLRPPHQGPAGHPCCRKHCDTGEACDLHQKYDEQGDDDKEDQIDPPEALAMPGAGPLLGRDAVGILPLRDAADLILLDLVHRRHGGDVNGLSIVVPAYKQQGPPRPRSFQSFD